MAAKKRLDIVVTERGLLPTRARARAAIMAGQVAVDGQVVDKAGALVDPEVEIAIKHTLPFASRGGIKLQKALDNFNICLVGRTVLDVGASTGGFTDCCLQAGARLVYAVDVGYGQLAWHLRTNAAVVNMERTNIRHVTRDSFTQGLPDFCCIDVAFISLGLVLPVVAQVLSPPAEVVMLVKPQFEAGRELVGKKGVVRDPQVHVQVLERVMATARQLEFAVANLDFSPLRGPQGNIEYLLHGHFKGGTDHWPDATAVVSRAHAHLK